MQLIRVLPSKNKSGFAAVAAVMALGLLLNGCTASSSSPGDSKDTAGSMTV